MSKQKGLVNLTRELIRINSENPPGNERNIARYVSSFLKDAGYSPFIVEFAPKRSNVWCLLKSRNSLKRILLSPHLDTVPAGDNWKVPPFAGKIINNRVYGRGASDCKGNLAVALFVLAVLKKKGCFFENLDIIFAATCDEETGSQLGFKPLLEKLLPLDYALILDGREFEMVRAQKGLLHLRINIFGRKAHGAYPEKGKNAIKQAMKACLELSRWVSSVNTKDNKAGLSLNIGRINGGEKVNIVADKCTVDLDFRFAKDIRLRGLLAKIKKLVQRASSKFSLEVLSFQRQANVRENRNFSQALKASLRHSNITVRSPMCKGATVLSFLGNKGIASFIFGFASSCQAHVTDEYIEIRNLIKGANVLKDFLIRLDASIV